MSAFAAVVVHCTVTASTGENPIHGMRISSPLNMAVTEVSLMILTEGS